MSLVGFLLFFGPLFGFLFLLALGSHLLWRLRRRAPRAAVPAPSQPETSVAPAFRVRRRRFRLWLWSGLAGGAAALALRWPLTALACGLLAPVAGALLHLRCPACDSTPMLRGLTRAGRCRRCGAYLAV